MIFGWTTCLTYETGNRNLGYNYFSRLLDEMKKNNMQRLLVMMENPHDSACDLYNHGLDWPVKNSKLESLIDTKAINAHESSEFFSKIVEKAKGLAIEIYIEIKYMGMQGVKQSYPGIFENYDANGRKDMRYFHICCDNDQAHQYMRDKVEDVLQRYPKIDGIALEHPSYWGVCSCQSTQSKFFCDTGKEISEAEILDWQNKRIAWAVSDLINLAKSIQKKIKFGMFTGFSPENGNIKGYQHNRGHSIETLRDIGLDFAMPYCEGRYKEKEQHEIERVIEYLEPLEIYLHTTIRRNPPSGYPLPPKDPKYIKNMIEWGKAYSKIQPRFLGMSFFNEVNIPQENRKAVYEAIKEKRNLAQEALELTRIFGSIVENSK